MKSHSSYREYRTLLANATTLEQWFSAGKALDKLEGKEEWKQDPNSTFYDQSLLQDRIVLLQKARESGDIGTMIFLLRTSLSRNIGDMGNRKVCHSQTMAKKTRISFMDIHTLAPRN